MQGTYNDQLVQLPGSPAVLLRFSSLKDFQFHAIHMVCDLAWGMLVLFGTSLGVSARVTIPTAQPAELTLLLESCSAPVQIKQGSLSSNVSEALQLLLLRVKLLNLYFSSCSFFFNVGLFKNHNNSKCILKASIFHC